MTIQEKLNDLIKERNYVSYDGIVAYAKQIGCKIETATRKLRPSLSPNVEPVWSGNAIAGYKWKDSDAKRKVEEWNKQFQPPVNNQRTLL